MSTAVRPRVLPGFSLTLGVTLSYLSLLVLLPLGACLLKAATMTPGQFWAAVWTDRARAAYALSLGTALAAAAVNAVLGLLVAWVLVRYPFPLKRLFDALVDLPFALPTAVAGLVFSSLYVPDGWLGRFLDPVLAPLGVKVAYGRLGIVLVLVFTGFPFVVRCVQPVLAGLEPELEEAASTLGAGRWQTFRRVLWPALVPAVLTGFALALARGLGEYGSVVFIAGNLPMQTEIAPVLVVARLEEFAYAEATALATVLLLMSFVLLALTNLLERWSKKYAG
jgi:sulfate transport system permease protein